MTKETTTQPASRKNRAALTVRLDRAEAEALYNHLRPLEYMDGPLFTAYRKILKVVR